MLRDTCGKESSILRDKLDRMGLIDNIHSCDFMVEWYIYNGTGLYSVVLQSHRELTWNQVAKLDGIFSSINAIGFLEWLGGATGWRYDSLSGGCMLWKRRIVVQLNTLQSVFTLFAPAEQKYLFAGSTKLTWKKHAELTSIVSDIRVWVESIKPKTDLARKLRRHSYSGPNALVN